MPKNSKKTVSYDLDTKFISAARKLKAAPKTSEGEFVKAFNKAGNFGDKLNVIGKFTIGRTDLYSIILDINKDIKADLEDEYNVKRLIQSLFVSALTDFIFIPRIHEEIDFIPIEFQILERQIHQLVAAIIDGKDEVEETVEADQSQGEEDLSAKISDNATSEPEKKEKETKDVKDVKKKEMGETKTEAKKEQINTNPVQPVVEKAQQPSNSNNTFYNTLKELEAVALQREAYQYANYSPMDSNADREVAYQQYANQFGTDPILIPEYRMYLNQFLTPQESTLFFADVQKPGFDNPQQPMGYQPQPSSLVNQQPEDPSQTTSQQPIIDTQQAQEDPVQDTITVEPQVKIEPKSKVVKEKIELSDNELTECVAKYLGYSSYKHFMNTFLNINTLKRKGINKSVDTDKIILNFAYLIRDMITKGGNTALSDAILKGGRFRASGIQIIDKVPFVVLRNNKMVLEINALEYLKPGNVIVFRINAQGKDAWHWMRIATGEMQPYKMVHQKQKTA